MEGVDLEAPGAEWDGHVLLLHGTEDERRAGLTAWVRRGLDLGEKVVYGEVPSRVEDSLVAVLEARGLDAAAAVREGRLAVLPLEDLHPPDSEAVVVDAALAEGFAAVRMAAEAGAALSSSSLRARRGFEQRVDALTRTRPVSALCQYAQATTTGARLDDAVAVHLTGVRQATLSTGPDEHGLVLRGEIDPTNTDVFTAVLAAASRRPSRLLRVDLAEVGYIDAGSCWRLDDATRRFRSGGGEVLLVAPQPDVARTMSLLEVDELPGVRMVGGRS
ncbi:MEDS domain-containing protein [Geodermatophilus sp. SYSU D00742]